MIPGFDVKCKAMIIIIVLIRRKLENILNTGLDPGVVKHPVVGGGDTMTFVHLKYNIITKMWLLMDPSHVGSCYNFKSYTLPYENRLGKKK